MLSKEQILILNEWQTLYFRDDNMPEYGYIYKKECIKDHKISTFYTIELHIIPETGCWLINVFYNNIECICNCVEDNAHSIPRFPYVGILTFPSQYIDSSKVKRSIRHARSSTRLSFRICGWSLNNSAIFVPTVRSSGMFPRNAVLSSISSCMPRGLPRSSQTWDIM